MSQLNLLKVTLQPISNPGTGELAKDIFYNCSFCRKPCGLNQHTRQICEQLADSNSLFCPFCIRHCYHTKRSKNVLVLSFRNFLGYLYYCLYLFNEIYISEIKDYEAEHQAIGLQNPVFNYDPETYLWFIDFSRVGNGKGKIGVDTVIKTTCDILSCLEICRHLPKNQNKIYNHYRHGILAFYNNHLRPADFLIPPLEATLPEGISEDYFQKFVPEDMIFV